MQNSTHEKDKAEEGSSGVVVGEFDLLGVFWQDIQRLGSNTLTSQLRLQTSIAVPLI